MRTRGRGLLIAAIALLTMAGLVEQPAAQQPQGGRGGGPAQVASVPAGEIRNIKVQGNVWMLVGAGSNIAVQVGDEGVLVVDTGGAGMTDKLLAAVREITDKPVRYVINTSVTPDHVGSNEALGRLTGGATNRMGNGPVPAIIAHENVLNRMSNQDGATPAYNANAFPTDSYFAKQRSIFFNGEAIDIIHIPSAHTDGDSLVHFRRSDVLVGGDIFTTTNFPLVDRARGGSYEGILAGLNRMIDITVPEDIQEGGTYVIPGHGRVSDEADLVEIRDQVHMIRDRIKALAVDQKMTLDQVKARRPLIDFQQRYSRPEMTGDMLIELLYQELTRAGAR